MIGCEFFDVHDVDVDAPVLEHDLDGSIGLVQAAHDQGSVPIAVPLIESVLVCARVRLVQPAQAQLHAGR